MARRRKPFEARTLQGFKCFSLIDDLLRHPRPVATQRDRAGNRQVQEERSLSADDRAAGVVRDVTLRRLGAREHHSVLNSRGESSRLPGSQPDQRWMLATNDLQLSADQVRVALSCGGSSTNIWPLLLWLRRPRTLQTTEICSMK